MDLLEYIVGFLVVALFIVSIFNFIFMIEDDNSEIQGLDTSGINLNSLEESLNSSKEQADGYAESFNKENPITSFGSLVLVSIVGIGKLVGNSVIIISNIVFGGIANILGIPSMVVGVISSILIVGLIFAAWKLYQTGK